MANLRHKAPTVPMSSSPTEPPSIRILHVTTVPLSLKFLRGQVGFMKAQGFEIHAISSPGPELRAFGDQEGVAVHAVEMPRRITPLRDLAAVGRLRAVLRRIRPHLVHAHTPKGGLLGMVAAWLARVPVRIYHMRGLPLMTATGAKRQILRTTERVACRLAHRVLCVSHSLREVALAEGLCRPDKIAVLTGGSGNGVDACGRFDPVLIGAEDRLAGRDRLRIPPEAVVAGFVGRIVRDKGLVELAEAWKALRESVPNLHLLIVGDFEPRDPVPPEVEDLLRNDPRIHLAGWVSDLTALYGVMDLVVLPTYREGFPNVPLEAAAMALPVVATRIPGCIDAVADGATGTLVPPRDANALAAAIRQYLVDPDLRRSHGQAGRERVLHDFRQEVIWDALYQEYVRLLREKDIPVPEFSPAPSSPDSTSSLTMELALPVSDMADQPEPRNPSS